MSLSKAKRLYTSKKNFLNHLLEPILTLLVDQSLGAKNLEETRRGFNASWEAFAATYDGLVKIQTEAETQEADMEKGNRNMVTSKLESGISWAVWLTP